MDASVPLAKQDFSLVLGGPLYQVFRRAHLSGPVLEQLGRRIWVITVVAWAPLLLLSAIEGRAVGPPSPLPFLRDIESQVRLLIALPVLIAAELVVHVRTRSVVAQFLDRGIVRPADVGRFDQLIGSAMRLRNSVPLEIGLVVLVATVGHWIWRSSIAFGAPSWYATPEGGRMGLSLAGVWYAAVSLPVTQFILLRWYLRLLIWFRFLRQVSRMDLHLVATHPDRAAGLSFLGKSTYAFGPFLFAQGALLSGLIATRVLYGGQNLTAFKLDAIGLIGFFVLVLLGPLTVFTPRLAEAKRSALGRYGKLASEYVGAFDQKWIRQRRSRSSCSERASVPRRPGSYRSSARVVPRGPDLSCGAGLPLLPLALTVFSLEELVIHLLKIVF
jgi:hypothetical protein